jgi:hypothetical protein
VSITNCSQPKATEPKTRQHKLRSGANWQEMLKQKGIKQTSIKQGLGAWVTTNSNGHSFFTKQCLV